MFKRFLFCFVLTVVSSISNANGTVDFQTDIIPLINQKPFFAKFLTDHLEFYPAGDAITIGREVNPNLALVRIGPYTLNAREKGSKGDYDIEVTIYTVTHFFLKNGKDVNGPQIKGVVKFTEDFDSIAVAKSETPMRADKAN